MALSPPGRRAAERSGYRRSVHRRSNTQNERLRVSSFPRKRDPRETALPLALDPRFRGGDGGVSAAGPRRSHRLQALVGRPEAIAVAPDIGFAVALFVDDLGLGVSEKSRVGELGRDLCQIALDLGDLLGEAGFFA